MIGENKAVIVAVSFWHNKMDDVLVYEYSFASLEHHFRFQSFYFNASA